MERARISDGCMGEAATLLASAAWNAVEVVSAIRKQHVTVIYLEDRRSQDHQLTWDSVGALKGPNAVAVNLGFLSDEQKYVQGLSHLDTGDLFRLYHDTGVL